MSENSLWKDEPEVLSFLTEAKRWKEDARDVLELASYAMHDHNPRPLFPGTRYVGVDWREGPGVDMIGNTANTKQLGASLGAGRWDLVLSISALEHDPTWYDTLFTAVSLARPEGGVIAVTCAGPGWEPHELDCAPPHATGLRYRNVSISEICGQIFSAAHFGRGIYVERLSAYYTRRAVHPHWRRSNVLAQLTSDPEMAIRNVVDSDSFR